MKISNFTSVINTTPNAPTTRSKQQLDDADIKAEKLNAEIEQHSPQKATPTKELSLEKVGDAITLSKETEALFKHHSTPSAGVGSAPLLKSAINHTTLAGNKFTFKDTEQGLIADITTKDGESYQVNISSELIMSEDKDGNLRFNDECTDGNDIVVSFSKDVTTGSGDDFVLLIKDPIRNPLRSRLDIDQQTTTIDTGAGNDTIHVVSNIDQQIDIKSGDGNDNITAESSESFGDAQGARVHVESGSGNDTVTASDLYRSMITTNDGNDKITVKNSYQLEVWTGDGDDELSLNTIDKVKVWMDNGADTVDAQRVGVANQRFQEMENQDRYLDDFRTIASNFIDMGSGDSTITLNQVSKMKVYTGSGDNKISLSGDVKDTTFLCANGDIKFDFKVNRNAFSNVMFLQLSDESARNLKEALQQSVKDASIELFTGSLGRYSSNIGINLTGGKKTLESEVTYKDNLYKKMLKFDLDEYV
jgi:hypothetical protein